VTKMACWLCGHEEEGRHHLGCARIMVPDLTPQQAAKAGWIMAPELEKDPEPAQVEVLKEGSMTTVPEEDIPAQGGETVGQCEVEGCENPKYSSSARAKYCADHKDPKNRKE